jgi:tellurite resistance protein
MSIGAYTIVLERTDLERIASALAFRPYRDVATLIANIQGQIDAQERASEPAPDRTEEQ